MTNTTSFQANPTHRALAACIKANVPVILWGMPGEAKTAYIESMGADNDMHVETVVGSVREPADFLGLPMQDKDERGNITTAYAPVGWATRLAAADKGLLFLDELTTAAPSTMKAMLRVMQERFVGDLHLHDGVAIVAAANPPDIAVDGWELAAPIANRMCHLDWRLDTDVWLDGFATGFESMPRVDLDALTGPATDADIARVRGLIASFLKHRPDMISACPTDPEKAGKGWASKRSWTNVASILAHVDRTDADTFDTVLIGCVGEAAATEFIAWMATADLADPDEVLADPSIVDWKNARPDQAFAMITTICALVALRDNDKTTDAAFEVMGACAEAGKPDVATPGILSLIRRGRMMPSKVARQFPDLLDRMDLGFAQG